MFKRISTILAGLFIVLSGLGHPGEAFSQGDAEVYSEPRVIDVETEESEIIESSVKLYNKLDRYVELTPLVVDLYSQPDSPAGQETSAQVKPFSYWIVLHRGAVRLAPGEEREYPLKIDIPKYAPAGSYYAHVVYSEGKNLADPGSISPLNSRRATLVRLLLKKKIVEEAELSGFSSEENIFFSTPVSFFFQIKNIGTDTISADGFLRIYNRRGEEIENFNVNQEQILPGEERGVAESWSPQFGFGKYQAKLILQYGGQGRRDLSDSVYFWVLPWQLLAVFIAAAILLFILFIYLIFWRNRQFAKKL